MTVKSPTVKITGLKPDTSYDIKVKAGRRTISDYCAYAGTALWNDKNFAPLPKSVGGIKLYDTWGGSTYNFTWNSPKNSQSGYTYVNNTNAPKLTLSDSGTYYVYIIANRKVGSRTYKSTVCNYATIYK